MATSNSGEWIRLDNFLKVAEVVQSGGEAKHLIQGGGIRVNGEVELRRARKLVHGDVVSVDDADFPDGEYPVEFA